MKLMTRFLKNTTEVLDRQRNALFVLMLLCVLVYSRTFSVPFYFDDYSYILQNPFIQHPGDIFDRHLMAETQVYVDVKNSVLARPLSYLTFSCNVLLNGTSVAGYHLVNIGIHAANTCLAYLLVLVIARSPHVSTRDTAPNDRTIVTVRLLAFFVAAIFAVHPVMTNAVTYIMQRMASLATLFYLLTIIIYVYSQQQDNRLKSCSWYLLALITTVAAFKSKEIAATVPIMLTLCDATFLRAERIRRFLRLMPFFVMIVVCILTSPDQFSEMPPGGTGGNPSNLEVLQFLKASPFTYLTTQFSTNPSSTAITSMSPLEYLYTQFRVVVTYQRMLLFPANLNFIHDYPFFRSLTDSAVAASLVFHLTLIIVSVIILRRFRFSDTEHGRLSVISAFGMLWFYIALIMECSIIPMDDHMLEHRMYLPSVGIIMAFTAIVILVCVRIWINYGRLLALALLGTVVVTFFCLTIIRNEQWRDPLGFWQDALLKSPNKHRIHGYIGNVYRDRGDMPRALREYRMMLANDYRYEQDHLELGRMLMEHGMYQEAVEEFQMMLKKWPDRGMVYIQLAEAYRHLGAEQLAADAEKNGKAVVRQVESGGSH